jgi:hypothetical protein
VDSCQSSESCGGSGGSGGSGDTGGSNKERAYAAIVDMSAVGASFGNGGEKLHYKTESTHPAVGSASWERGYSSALVC